MVYIICESVYVCLYMCVRMYLCYVARSGLVRMLQKKKKKKKKKVCKDVCVRTCVCMYGQLCST